MCWMNQEYNSQELCEVIYGRALRSLFLCDIRRKISTSMPVKVHIYKIIQFVPRNRIESESNLLNRAREWLNPSSEDWSELLQIPTAKTAAKIPVSN